MDEIIGVGVCLLLALVIIVGIIAVFQSNLGKRPSSQGHLNNLAPLTALASIAEEAHRHSPPDLNALTWTPASPLAPGEDDSPKAIPTLVELSERVEVLEARLDQIVGSRGGSVRSNETVPLS